MGKKSSAGKAVEKSKGQILIYQTEEGQARLEVRLEGETLWLSQKGMAELYQTSPPALTMILHQK